MTRALAAALSIIVAAVASPALAGPALGVDPVRLYGPEIRFEVRRNGEPIGEQSVSFEHRGDRLVVRERSDLAVKLLFVTVYRFSYSSTAVWREGRLQSMEARVDDDGKKATLEVRSEGGQLVVTGPEGRQTYPATLRPSGHWDPVVLKERQILNTITGNLNEIKVTDQGMDQVQTADGPRAARKYVYTGDLDATVWYDDQGRWVSLAFAGRDGSKIEYVCKSCGLPVTTAEQR